MARTKWKPKTGGVVAQLPAERGMVDILDGRIFVKGKDLTVEKLEEIQNAFFKGEAMMMPENNGIIIQPLRAGGFGEDLADIASDIGDNLGYYVPPRLLNFSRSATLSAASL